MADSNQGDQPEMMIQPSKPKEQEVKPEKTRNEKLVQAIAELYEPLQGENVFKVNAKKFCEIIDSHTHKGMDDLKKSLHYLDHFKSLLD